MLSFTSLSYRGTTLAPGGSVTKLAPSLRRISRFASERPIPVFHPEFSRICRVGLRVAWPIELWSAIVRACSYPNIAYINTQDTRAATVEIIGGDDWPRPVRPRLVSNEAPGDLGLQRPSSCAVLQRSRALLIGWPVARTSSDLGEGPFLFPRIAKLCTRASREHCSGARPPDQQPVDQLQKVEGGHDTH